MDMISTIASFNEILWHDIKVYGFAFDDEDYNLYLDVDLIVEWIEPSSKEGGYLFKVSPATLVFRNAWDILFDIQVDNSLVIDSAYMGNPHVAHNADSVNGLYEYDFVLSLHQGEISFKSIGLDVYVRALPSILESQSIGLKERGGVSFLMQDVNGVR